MFLAAEPEIDDEGIFFLCLGCGHRNPLINVAGRLGEINLGV
jgi:hypothetical protein